VNGAQRWIRLGGFTLQASEFAKPLLLLYMAGYLSRPAVNALARGKRKSQDSAQANMVKLLPAALAVTSLGSLLLLQPDFGATVVLAVMTIGMLFVAGTRLGYFILLVLAAAAVLALLIVVQPYRWNRLVSFSDPWSHAFGGGYQLTQALIGFGRGDWFGLGLGEGVQKLFYLPEAHNDFILAVIAEELGIVGVLAVLALLLLVVYRAFRSGRRALNAGLPFAGYLCYGVGLLLGVQVLFNAGVNTGLLPTKGLTLPFISYGGNSLLVCCALLGLVARADIEVATAAEPRRRKRGYS
jgi:cell division protein FtsW